MDDFILASLKPQQLERIERDRNHIIIDAALVKQKNQANEARRERDSHARRRDQQDQYKQRQDETDSWRLMRHANSIAESHR